MDFEVFRGKYSKAGSSAEPRIGLSRRGVFSINKAAYELLGEPERVLLLFDAERSLAAFEPDVDGTDPNSFKVTQQGESTSYVVSAKSFCNYYEILHDRARSFTAHEEGDRLVFPLEER